MLFGIEGESLLSSLTSMEQSYKTYLSNRKLEIEKTISLSAFAPQALITLILIWWIALINI
jgi:hypothetical protein